MKIFERSSTCIQVMEEVWHELRQVLPELPPAIILLSRRSRTRAYFAPLIWRFTEEHRHEIGMNVLELGNAKELLAVLLHEAAHAINFVRRVQDTSGRYNYYHKKEFRDMVLELGLGCEWRNTRYGWTDTFYKDSLEDRYSNVLSVLNIMSFGGTKPQPPPPSEVLPKSGQSQYICRCDPPRRVSMAESTACQGAVLCGICMQPFTPRPTNTARRRKVKKA